MESLSTAQARKLVLLSQRLPPAKRQKKSATLAHLEHLGYIQIDTISVVQRAHHHVLWSRNSRYRPEDIDKLIADGQAFEYWSHAAAFLPMCDYRHSLPRKAALASGAMDHWYARDQKVIKEVLARIQAEGPLKARDFEHDKQHKIDSKQNPADWYHKPAKRALTYLFMQGDLMCSHREGFQMVYDLRERVLPEGVDTRHPTDTEHARHLIMRYLRAHGLGQIKDAAYLRKGIKPLLEATALQMLEDSELVKVSVNQKIYLALSDQLDLLGKRLVMDRACILSPFDNLLIQRHRMHELFGFDYQIECYTPEAKRKFGYFTLPVLWRGRLTARLDCKADRKTRTLVLNLLHPEDHLKKKDEFASALGEALIEYCQFNDCDSIDSQALQNSPLNNALRAHLVQHCWSD